MAPGHEVTCDVHDRSTIRACFMPRYPCSAVRYLSIVFSFPLLHIRSLGHSVPVQKPFHYNH